MQLAKINLLCLIFFTFCFVYANGRGNRNCKSCGKEISPVCGSDGIIYSSMCELKRQNCKSRTRSQSVYLVADNKCMRSAGSTCNHKCINKYDPVCGSDARTYLNKCIFRVEQCRSGISFAHFGPCITALNRTLTSCPTTCADSQKDGPICASDGNVYNSTCDMLLRTCGQKVVKTTHKHCQTTKSCQDVCFYDYKSVCGSDGRIYQSRCQMKVKNCGKHIFEVPLVNCRPQERTTNGCPISCADEKLSPVCGSDGNIYDSDCDMKRLNCGSGNALNIFIVDLQRCRKRFQTCEKIICPASYDPVCGTDDQTYINYCLMHKANCKKGIELAHYGKCSTAEPEDCESACIHLESSETFPVCGSDGNVYENLCDMKKRTCGQKVVPVALHHCEATRHCLSECKDAKKAAVCGSDSKMYRNTCEMKAKNCGRHVYEVPLGDCLKGFNFFHCMRFCPSIFDPVCGTDGKTYSNECFLKMENCRSRSLGRSLVTRTYFGKCGYPQPQAKLYMFR